jgi:hypothetical protein
MSLNTLGGPIAGLGAALTGFDSGLEHGTQIRQQAALNQSEIQKNQAYGDWMEQRNATGIAEARLRGVDPALIRAAAADAGTAEKLGTAYGLTPGQIMDYGRSLGSNQPIPGYPGSDGMPTPLPPSVDSTPMGAFASIPRTVPGTAPITGTNNYTSGPAGLLAPMPSNVSPGPATIPTTPPITGLDYHPPIAARGMPQIGIPGPVPQPRSTAPGLAPMPSSMTTSTTPDWMNQGPQKGGLLSIDQQKADNGTVTANNGTISADASASRAQTYAKIGDADVKETGAKTQTILANLPFIAPRDAAQIALWQNEGALKKVQANMLPSLDKAKENLYDAQTTAAASIPGYRQGLLSIAQGNLADRTTLLKQTLTSMGVTDNLTQARIADIYSKDQDGSFRSAMNTMTLASKVINDPLANPKEVAAYQSLLSQAITVVTARLGKSGSSLDTGGGSNVSSPATQGTDPNGQTIRPFPVVTPSGIPGSAVPHPNVPSAPPVHPAIARTAHSAMSGSQGQQVTYNGKQYSVVPEGPYLKLFNQDGSYSGHYITRK